MFRNQDLGASFAHFCWGVVTPGLFQGTELVNLYMHVFIIISILLAIEKHVFTLIAPIPIQQNRVQYNFLPPHICNSPL